MHKSGTEGTKIRDMEPADADCVAGFMVELNRSEARISVDRDPSEQAGKNHFEYLCGEITALLRFRDDRDRIVAVRLRPRQFQTLANGVLGLAEADGGQ